MGLVNANHTTPCPGDRCAPHASTVSGRKYATAQACKQGDYDCRTIRDFPGKKPNLHHADSTTTGYISMIMNIDKD